MNKVIKVVRAPKYRLGNLSNGEQVEVPVNMLLDAENRNWNYREDLKKMLYKSQHSEATEQLVNEWEEFFFKANIEIVEYWNRNKKISFIDKIKSFFGGKTYVGNICR